MKSLTDWFKEFAEERARFQEKLGEEKVEVIRDILASNWLIEKNQREILSKLSLIVEAFNKEEDD